MDELHQGPPVADALQRAPISIIAEVRAGVARQANGQSGPSKRSEKTRERRVACQRALPRVNRPAIGTVTAQVWKQDRPRIAGAGLDANVAAAAGKAEDQQHVGLLRQELCQVAIDRRIGGRKDMACDVHSSERRAPPPHQSLCQIPARI